MKSRSRWPRSHCCSSGWGAIAFGGPAAHTAVMEDEFVRRRKWLTCQEFLDRLGASNLIPGPSSTEMAIHIGFSKRGWPGLVVAGSCFIVPAAVLVSLIAAAYLRYGDAFSTPSSPWSLRWWPRRSGAWAGRR